MGEQYGDSTQLLYLRARHYSPADGRFTSRDTWSGDYSNPLTLNAWNYTNANPINYTDPSEHCIFTGFDTVACIVALAIGIPVVAGVTTAAWDYGIAQGGGLGGINWANPDCIDWSRVVSAGGSGTVAAFEKILAIPLGFGYLMNSLMGVSPTQTNAGLLGFIDLDDEYLALQINPYYIAGGYGGQAGATYVSIASLIKGLPTGFTNQQIPLTSPQSLLGNNGMLVLNPGISVSIPIPVGGNIGLLGIGTSGLASLMNGSGGSGHLYNGASMTEDEVLDAAKQFLGDDYTYLGNGRFVSKDGLRQFRIGDSDLLGYHGGGPHANFEILAPNPLKPGKMLIVQNIHIYLIK